MSRLAVPTMGLAAAAALLAGCGDDENPGPSAADAVTIEHIHGATEIRGTPERVVALAAVDADTATALGVTPLLVAQAPGSEPGKLSPWFAASAGDADVTIINVAGGDQEGEIPFEQVAAANPDLILGMGAGIDAQEYGTLSGIAPTVAPKIGDFLDAWPDITRTIGTALGRPEEAEELITETEGTIATAVAEHPEFQGKTFVASLLFAADQFGVLVDTRESTVSLMTGLGFTLKPEVDNLQATLGYATQVSRERASLLDADVTLAYAPDPDVAQAYLDDPLVQRLDVVERGAFIQVERLLWGAFRNPSVLSIPYAVDQIVPQLAGVNLG